MCAVCANSAYYIHSAFKLLACIWYHALITSFLSFFTWVLMLVLIYGGVTALLRLSRPMLMFHDLLSVTVASNIHVKLCLINQKIICLGSNRQSWSLLDALALIITVTCLVYVSSRCLCPSCASYLPGCSLSCYAHHSLCVYTTWSFYSKEYIVWVILGYIWSALSKNIFASKPCLANRCRLSSSRLIFPDSKGVNMKQVLFMVTGPQI